MNKMPQTPYWDDPRLLKKYAKLLNPSGNLVKSRSSMTLPFMLPKIPAALCMCNKCSCIQCKNEPYTFDNNTELGSNSLTLDQNNLFKDDILNCSYYKVIFYAIGSFCGLSLVALLAWILSNDFIWGWANKQKEIPRNVNVVYGLLTYIGGAILYTLNTILSNIYRVAVLPRNAVFETEPIHSTWWDDFF